VDDDFVVEAIAVAVKRFQVSAVKVADVIVQVREREREGERSRCTSCELSFVNLESWFPRFILSTKSQIA
jgi:hypothetical protein